MHAQRLSFHRYLLLGGFQRLSRNEDTVSYRRDVIIFFSTQGWKPCSFGYDITNEFGTRLFHNEQCDNKNAKTGTYGYRDANGIFRTVSYVADADGYRATIDTNVPGTAPRASADAVFNANPVAAPATAPRLGAYTRTPYTGPAFTRLAFTPPAAPVDVRGPGGYTGGYAGGYGGGFRAPYGGGSGG
ncbi:hypothetical protein HPB49_013785 [Dermacentor silvarum]|uniref:Uncharacterized protein n=1 Tax=Dermacentor silvarum TaxID=543639 RepID=A0ACB8DDH1_DERSI|nr:hypothetical protein HPB49_013785 [Dermacentor silvarum]